MAVSAIILSGGRSSRFGGVHKPGVDLGGRTVISRILGAVRALDADARVWVAGPTTGLSDAEAESVSAVREDPEFAGPLAGIAAAAQQMGASEGTTLIIAGDMPLVTAAHLGKIVSLSEASGGPVTGTDDRGKAQFLCAAWPHSLLRQRLARIGDPEDKAVRLLFDDGEPRVIDVDPEVVVDFDTADELARIRSQIDRG